jgi:hypothetical protein
MARSLGSLLLLVVLLVGLGLAAPPAGPCPPSLALQLGEARADRLLFEDSLLDGLAWRDPADSRDLPAFSPEENDDHLALCRTVPLAPADGVRLATPQDAPGRAGFDAAQRGDRAPPCRLSPA